MKKSNPLPYLPDRFQRFIHWLKSNKVHSKIVFFTLGILSTTWFLIRVIPKPSRASYPCMQATAPYMSAFVLWLTGIGGSAFSLVQFRKTIYKAKYLLAFVFLLMMSSFYLITQFATSQKSSAMNLVEIKGDFPPNEPMGVAQGIYPGRVVWNWNPDATNESCDNSSNNNGFMDEDDNAWFQSKNNNFLVIDSMIANSLNLLTGEENVADSWDAIFRFYNYKNGNGDVGYNNNEIVFIKINATSIYGAPGNRYYDDLSRNDDTSINAFNAETNPYVVLSVLKQLIEEAGVPQDKIYIGDPARNIYKEFYDLWYIEYPDVNYLGNNLIHPELDIVSLGRTPVENTEEEVVFYSDNGSVMPEAVNDKLFTIFEEMDYMINIPTLKAHATAGITMAAKNHFGSFTRDWALHLHDGLMKGTDEPERLGYFLYRIQTDIMMHRLLGGKTMLIVMDALYPGEDALGVPEKWEMSPFNNHWCSSVFTSLDPVALESVGHDFLRTEYNGATIAESRPNWDGVDDYLHQAADSANWPEDVVYDPDNDGVILTSLGVHEHWNNSDLKQYSRNLGSGEGIELIKAHDTIVGISENINSQMINVYPNPVNEILNVENKYSQAISYQIISNDGKIIFEGNLDKNASNQFNFSVYSKGVYFIRILNEEIAYSGKIIKQ